MIDIKKCAEELDEKLKKYHDKNQATPKEPLYHYTSFLGLSGIFIKYSINKYFFVNCHIYSEIID